MKIPVLSEVSLLVGLVLCILFLPFGASAGVILVVIGLLGFIGNVNDKIPGPDESMWGGHE